MGGNGKEWGIMHCVREATKNTLRGGGVQDLGGGETIFIKNGGV